MTEPKTTTADHDPIPPDGCNCASFWTIRGKHKADCPIAQPTAPAGEPDYSKMQPVPMPIVKPAPPKPSESTELDDILMEYAGAFAAISSLGRTDMVVGEIHTLKKRLETLISEQTTKARIDELERVLAGNHGTYIHVEPIQHRLAKLNSGDTND